MQRLLQTIRSTAGSLVPSLGASAGNGEIPEAPFASAVQSLHLAFFTTDMAGIITGWNPGAERLLGYSSQEIIGCDVSILVPIDRRGEIETIRSQLNSGQRVENLGTARLAKGGRPVDVICDISPMRSSSGALVGCSAIMRDVTDQRLAEELFRLAVEACPCGMMMVDRGGRIVMVNSEIERQFGYRRAVLIGQPVEILLPVDLRAAHGQMRAEFTKQPVSRKMGKGRDMFGLRKDGSEFPLDIELTPIHIRDGLLFLGVVVDISERKQAEQLKDEFVSTVSHELRTPLTSITASLSLLTANAAGELPPAAARLVSIASNNAKRLGRLVNDILDIEKIESDRTEFRYEKVEVRSVVDRAMDDARSLAGEYGLRLRLDADSVAAFVHADPDRLLQVITNLLSNAIKFSPRDEEVVVAISRRASTVRITVRDHGPGIPDHFKSRVFDKFAQADASDSRQKGGTGLGLSIVKQIVIRLGGNVGFDSAVGQGTLFWVDLPSFDAAESRQIKINTGEVV